MYIFTGNSNFKPCLDRGTLSTSLQSPVDFAQHSLINLINSSDPTKESATPLLAMRSIAPCCMSYISSWVSIFFRPFFTPVNSASVGWLLSFANLRFLALLGYYWAVKKCLPFYMVILDMQFDQEFFSGLKFWFFRCAIKVTVLVFRLKFVRTISALDETFQLTQILLLSVG